MECLQSDVVPAVRRGVPICPGCGEGQQIEPLQRVRNFWYMRCLACHFGVRMSVLKSRAVEERRSGLDRRTMFRGGLRFSDRPAACHCERCDGPAVSWLRTPEALWARCEHCGRITRLAP